MDGFKMSFTKFLEGLHQRVGGGVTRQMPSCDRDTLLTINSY